MTCIDPGDLDIPSQANIQDPKTWQLQLGETLVVYHPHSKRPPQVLSTKELLAPRQTPKSFESSLPLDDSRPPYFPFKTLADFGQTELFVKRDQTDSHINEQLDLWRRHAPGTGVTLRNAREMHKCLEAAGTEEDISKVRHGHDPTPPVSVPAHRVNLKFEQVEIEVPYKHSNTTETRKYKVRFRPALEAVKHVLEDPALQGYMIYHPERHYVRKPGTNENMRVWSDVHTADDWWELQASGGYVVLYIFY